MTRLRQTVAKRLKSAQENAALLTTFNDVDMSAVMEARAKYSIGQPFMYPDNSLGYSGNFLRMTFRSEERTSELQSLMRISYAVFCLNKKKNAHNNHKKT